MHIDQRLHPHPAPVDKSPQNIQPIVHSQSSSNSYKTILFPQYANGNTKQLKLWPDPARKHDDRILDQMRYVPASTLRLDPELESSIKTIYLPGGIGSDTPKGRKKFKDEECPVDMCWITDRYCIETIFTIFGGGFIIKAATYLFCKKSFKISSTR